LGFLDAKEMLIKAQLVSQIARFCANGMSQQQAAKVLGLTQPKLSKMLRGQFRGISEMKMMDCLSGSDAPSRSWSDRRLRPPTNALKSWRLSGRDYEARLRRSGTAEATGNTAVFSAFQCANWLLRV